MDNSVKKFFSVVIPCWDIKGKGAEYLDHSFNVLANQTFRNFEVVVSDHSEDDNIKNLCDMWKQELDITYVKNSVGRGKIAPNLNNAMKLAKGEYVKFLFQDDFLYDQDSLQTIHYHITNNPDKYWFVNACVHTRDAISCYDKMVPVYHDLIHRGVNTISCPTVLTIKNENVANFDESLNWLVDVEYYKRLYVHHGLPVIIEEVCAVNRDSDIRTTTMTTEQQKIEETIRVTGMFDKLELDTVTIAAVAGTKAKETLAAIKYSMKNIKFARAILITPEDLQDDEVEIIKCEPLNYEQYNHFIVYRLADYVDTEHCLVVQNDGYVVNSHCWTNDFLKYDYIGAPWPLPKDNYSFRDPQGEIQRVGNGGFSLRSKKLLALAKELNLEWKEYFGFYHEDGFVCCHNRSAYENNGCKFAPIEVAASFSQESDNIHEQIGKISFGFHGRGNQYYAITQKQMI